MHAHVYPIQGGHEQIIKAPVTKCDMGTQTDTHFVQSNIVKSYEWNEWELRRKAIKLVIPYNHLGDCYIERCDPCRQIYVKS